MASKIRRSEESELLAASASATIPLLLELARNHAARRRPADLITQYARDGFVVPSFHEIGCHFPRRRAVLRATSACEVLAQRIERRLGDTLPHVELRREPLDAPYYDGLRVMFGADSVQGEWIPIGDLGRFDWLAKLTSNRRQRFVAAGFGLQLAPVMFRPTDLTSST